MNYIANERSENSIVYYPYILAKIFKAFIDTSI